MRVAIVSSIVPFVNGGGRFIVEWLHAKLLEHGHQSEIVYLPFIDIPERMLEQVLAYRMIDLTASADRLICIRPPAHVLPHPNKVVWFIHHFRAFYDLWDSPYLHLPRTPRMQQLRKQIIELDNRTLSETQRIYTISDAVGSRLKKYNSLASETLYYPLLNTDHFRHSRMNDEVVCVGRMEPHKRPHLLVEAMSLTKSKARLRLCGASGSDEYVASMQSYVKKHNLHDRVSIENRWISEAEKADLLAEALAVGYVPFEEDGYGYPTLEAAYSEKPVIAANDSGGVLEVVIDGVNGFVCEPTPASIAAAIDELHGDRIRARAMGSAARSRLADLRIDWDHVVVTLLS